MQKINKLFSLAVALAMVASLFAAFPVIARAATSGTCGDDLTWTLDDAGTLAISGTGDMTNYSWSGTPWYSSRSSIKTVVIGDGVTSIGNRAFWLCSQLTRINIPNGVNSIGEYAFSWCESLSNVMLPESMISIGDWAFEGCDSLTSIAIPDSVTSIGESAFYSCSSLSRINVGYNNENYCSIDGNLFTKDKKTLMQYAIGKTAASYTVPDCVTVIGRSAFVNCESLVDIMIPASVTSIGVGAFGECESLKNVEVDSGNEFFCSIDGNLFSKDKTKLILYATGKTASSYTVPDGVKCIGSHAFYYCDSIERIVIPDSVTEIWTYAFMSCINLTDISLPDGITCIEEGLFDGCYSLKTIEVPKNVTTIESYAFESCDALTSIILPDSITEIGYRAFHYCTSLTDVYYGGSEEDMSNIEINDDNDELIAATWHYNWSGEQEKNIIASGTCGANLTWTLDDAGTLTISGTGAMIGWSYGDAPWYSSRGSIKTVVIDDGVTAIGDWAFRECTSLTSIVIPDSVTTIGYGAFSDCTSLTSVVIGDGVTEIGECAFLDCTSLTSVVIPDSVTTIGDYAFYECTSLTSITVDVSNKYYCSVDGNLFTKDKKTLVQYAIGKTAASYKIPTGVTTIGSCAFSDCTSLTSIVIPDSVTSIGNGAFFYCTSLTSVVIPDGVTSIGEGAFEYCSSLTSITIPDSVTNIGEDAFYWCTSLTSIVIPDGVTTIGWCAFYYCTSLTDVYYGGSEEDRANIEIGDYNSYLTNATWHYNWGNKTVINIGDYIQMGTYYGEPILWRCVDIDENGPLMLSDKIICLKAFDAKGTNTSGSHGRGYYDEGTQGYYRQSYAGSSYWADSNIRDWLNSTDTTVTWTCGNPPDTAHVYYNSYDDEAGFLTNFTASEHAAMKTVTQKSLLDRCEYSDSSNNINSNYHRRSDNISSVLQNYDAAYSEQVTDTVFLLDVKQVYNVYQNDSLLGGNNYYIGYPTAQAVSNSNSVFKDYWSLTSTDRWSSWLRSPDSGGPYAAGAVSIGVRCVEPDGSVQGGTAYYGGVGVRPAFYLNDETCIFASGDGTEASPYSVVGSGEQKKDIIASGACGDNLTWTLDDAGTLTISGTGDMTNWSTYSSTPWYSYLDNIKTVAIEFGVTSIGNNAFLGCDLLISVTIPDSVTTIGNKAFFNCESLVSVTIPDSVASIGDDAFADCDLLISVTIPDSVTSIGNNAFRWCKSLASITIPDSVTSIGNYAFAHCNSLMSINVSESNQKYCSINGNLFSKDNTLLIQYAAGKTEASYLIPNSVTIIGDLAFASCSFLESITIPNCVTIIDNNAFRGCHLLTSVTIPDSVTSIGDYAFAYCYSLASVTIPDSVTSIGDYAFDNCRSLTNIIIPDSVTEIAYGAFSDCGSLTRVTIPDSVTSIGDWAFDYCRSLTSIIIPDSVTHIGLYAFNHCSSLKSINIPNEVTSIGDGLFDGCISLTSITIPHNVTSIGNHAFYGCGSLKSICIPDSVTSIGDWAFYYCDSLTSITIPDSVTSIGERAFSNCTKLTDVYYGGSEEDRANIKIDGNNELLSATWHYYSGDAAISKITTGENPVTVKLGGEVEAGKRVMVAIYSANGEFLGIASAVTDADTHEYTLDMDIPEDAVVKAFLWDSYGSLSPICKAVTEN